jgi:1-deoxy-D-xylulose-5-phosphate reductoisomerase
MKKKIIILGSTGSIGSTTYELIKKNKHIFQIKLLSTNKNIKKLINQAIEMNVKNLIITDQKTYISAVKKYKNRNFNFYNTFQIIDNLFKPKEIYYAMISLSGLSGLMPTLKTIKYCKNIGIVNKESLVCAWNLIKIKLKYFKTNFIPIDSEHFSIYSILKNDKSSGIKKLYLTASGGPFLNSHIKTISNASVSQVTKHPNWKMGKKISVDSCTMMNKVFEVIEAKNIFDLKYKDIKILTHPNSYVHAIIKFKNNTVKFLAHEPYMTIPISQSLKIEEKNIKLFSEDINLKILNNLNLKKVDLKKFPLVKILEKIPQNNSLFETALVTINDFFVEKFLKKKISYKKLIKSVEYHVNSKVFTKFKNIPVRKLEDIVKLTHYVHLKLNKLSI